MRHSLPSLIFVALFLFIATSARGQYIITFAGIGATPGYSGDGGPATDANMRGPSDIAFDASWNLYITDFINNVIRKVDTFGIITTVAGTGYGAGSTGGGGGFTGDGGPATNAELNGPYGLAVDALGDIIFADGYNHVVRMVTPSGTISTIAGNHSVAGYLGDGGAATDARLNNPVGIAIDKAGNIYIADDHNNAIRKINTSGTITTVAGGNTTAGYSGDGGQATAAQLSLPIGVAVDTAGNLFIADSHNNAIRKVTKTGIISTYAGSATAGYTGDGGLATAALLDSPTRVNFDDSDNLYISDYYNNVVRKVNHVTGIITTIAGDGFGYGSGGATGGYSGDDSLAINAELYLPQGVAFDLYHRMYICDRLNDVIRRVGPQPPVDHTYVGSIYGTGSSQLTIYPNPSYSGAITINLTSKTNCEVQVTITDVLGKTVQKKVIETNKPSTINMDKITGIYFLNAITEEGEWNAKIIMAE